VLVRHSRAPRFVDEYIERPVSILAE